MAVKLGSASTGIVVAYLTWYFVSRFAEFTAQGLTAIVAILAGAAVAGMIAKFADDKEAFAYYPIGLLVGSIAWIVMRTWVIPGTLPATTGSRIEQSGGALAPVATGLGAPAASTSTGLGEAAAGVTNSTDMLVFVSVVALLVVVAVGLVIARRRAPMDLEEE